MSASRKRLCSENQIRKRSLFFSLKDFIKRYPESGMCHSDIKTITDKYRDLNACHSECRRDNHFSHVLYLIAESMYRSRFQDSSYVELVLRYIFEMNGDMNQILFPGAYRFPAVLLVEKADFVEYFLEHAYRRNMLFDGYRLPCTFSRTVRYHSMLEAAALSGEHLLLRQMLRFGAFFSYGENYSLIRESRLSKNRSNCLLFLTISKMLGLNPELLPIKDVTCVDGRRRRYENLMSCFKLLVKECSMSSLAELHEKLSANPHCDFKGCPEKENVIDFIRVFSANVVDDFQNHFIMALSLKEVSRLVIRRKLNKNWALPGGIYKLPLPEVLKIYLDVY